ncbi:unnamed protein product [Blepharisma stoltei]|uniref:Uncharacterized protein n=1 Tax=Blepharisma stoltei TaxID=1481888 RepID=A0AAU9JI88_9CILI|nr:unnamed protein product [Blepharisma stoltei]
MPNKGNRENNLERKISIARKIIFKQTQIDMILSKKIFETTSNSNNLEKESYLNKLISKDLQISKITLQRIWKKLYAT